jgi:hypothetical protein
MKLINSLSLLLLLVLIGACNFVALGIQLSSTSVQSNENLTVIPTETEPNNTALTANTIDLNGSISGTINIDGDYNDFFKVTLPSDGKIAFSISQGSFPGGYLDLYDQNGYSFLKQSLQTGDPVNDLLIYENLKAGTYYIRISGGGNISYTLTNTFTQTALASGNDAEPNDKQSESVSISLNGSNTGHMGFWGNGEIDNYDYYAFTTQYDGKIAFAVVPESTLDAYLDLYDQNGYSFLRASIQTGVGITDSLIYQNLKVGTYFVRVGGGGYGSYTLNNVFTPTAIPNGNDIEPNSTYSEASPISNGNSKTGHLGYWGNGSIDDYDWFTFSTPSKGTVKLKATPESSLDLYFDLYTASGNTFLRTSSNSGPGKTDTLFYENLDAGTYYIRIAGGGYGSYTLTYSFKEAGVSVDNSILEQLKIIPDNKRGILMINNINPTCFTSVEIVELSGKTILKERLTNTNNQIDFSDRKGLFLIKVSSKSETRTTKVVF